MAGRDVVIARSYSLERRGALTYADGLRLAESADLARRLRIPLVFIVASSGADVLDGVAALHGWGKAAAAIAACSGIVPVLMAATGPVVSGPALLLGAGRPGRDELGGGCLRLGTTDGGGIHRRGGRAARAGRGRPPMPGRAAYAPWRPTMSRVR